MSIGLWLVRHGATDWSDAGRLNGWTDVPLNDRGRVQARLLGPRLAKRDFSGVWSSDLARAAETARLAVGEPVLEPSLRELHFGNLEGKRWEELPAAVQGALLEFGGFEAPCGESVAASGSASSVSSTAFPAESTPSSPTAGSSGCCCGRPGATHGWCRASSFGSV